MPVTTQPVPPKLLAGKPTADMTFREKVWTLCATVPRGKVTTYGAIARALGQPGASRAVGMAMNTNPYAPTIPCHRVVGTNRALIGYAGGLPRKREMLLAEGVALEGDKVAKDAIISL